MNKLNGFSKVNFTCDSCGKKFQQEIAYSAALNWEESDNNHTYCLNCAEKEEKKTEQKNKTKKQKSWGTAPINEVSENTQSLNIDKRTLKKTGRVHLFATRVKKEWIEQLKSIAYEERKHYNEILEEALECYENQRKETKPTKKLSTQVKIIEPKPEPQKKLTPYHLEGFGCDKCGNEYYNETAYSYAPSMNEINDYHTYCSVCVK